MNGRWRGSGTIATLAMGINRKELEFDGKLKSFDGKSSNFDRKTKKFDRKTVNFDSKAKNSKGISHNLIRNRKNSPDPY
ncbi:MAG: hypothetical protein AB2374_02755 [Cytobacillus gottheilii]|uniref:hypothetical protein n=1 Tax=Cytobacillus gottheilii TaxID=859144 RepID=UPI00082DBDA0|nr:hypothetical protein [Cytobacillus gottheilii]